MSGIDYFVPRNDVEKNVLARDGVRVLDCAEAICMVMLDRFILRNDEKGTSLRGDELCVLDCAEAICIELVEK